MGRKIVKVICIDNKTPSGEGIYHLTIGKEYKAKADPFNLRVFVIVNDIGIRRRFKRSLFQVCGEPEKPVKSEIKAEPIKVRCINNRYVNYDKTYHLTVGKEYVGFRKGSSFYTVTNDRGEVKTYLKKLFEIVK